MFALLFLISGMVVFVAAGMAHVPILALVGVFLALLSLSGGRRSLSEDGAAITWTTIPPDAPQPAKTTYLRRLPRRFARQTHRSHCPAYSRKQVAQRGRKVI
jgi:hypothetical protein